MLSVNTNNILIAEDDENDRFLIQRAFTKAGINVPISFVIDGQEAIDYIQSRQGSPPATPETDTASPTLLLLDLKMPRLDGFQVLEWLNANPVYKPMLVVVFTSSSDPKDLQRARELGADSFIIKPHDGSDYIRIAQDLERQISCLTQAHSQVAA
jgi:CheY-like chemotaxis protein